MSQFELICKDIVTLSGMYPAMIRLGKKKKMVNFVSQKTNKSPCWSKSQSSLTLNKRVYKGVHQ